MRNKTEHSKMSNQKRKRKTGKSTSSSAFSSYDHGATIICHTTPTECHQVFCFACRTCCVFDDRPVNHKIRIKMEIAKSFFGSRDHEGYVGKEEHTVSYDYQLQNTINY